MPDTNTRYGPGPTQSQASKDGEHRVPRSHRHQKEDPRDLNRNGRQEGQDRSRTIPPPEYEHRSPEKRPTQDRNNRVQEHDRRREERTQVGKEASRDRHRDGRSRQQRHQDAGSRDRHREDRSRDRVDQSRYQEEGTQDRYWDERSQDKHHKKTHSREQDRYWDERGQSFPRDPREVEFHQESSNYKKEAFSLGYGPSPQSPSFDEREYYESRPKGGILECNKCRYLCTGRGVVQILEVVLNAMVLICVVSSYFILSGMSSSFSSGGDFGNVNFPFEGQELQQVRQLDQQFTVMRSPLMYGGLAFSVAMGAMTLGVLAAGAKHLQDLSRKWLLLEAAFSLLAALACGTAVGIFLHFALEINSTDVCKQRERLYARNGLSWMNCSLAGTDGAAATFAIILIMFYIASLVLAVRSFREKMQYREYPEAPPEGMESAFPNNGRVPNG